MASSVDGAHPVQRNDPDESPSFSDTLGVIASQLSEIAAQLQRGAIAGCLCANDENRSPGELATQQRPQQALVSLARHVYWLRRQRAQIFGSAELFGEPAWDILLDLYIAYGEGKQVSVSSACIGSASPPTTGLRWLGVLADKELVTREADAQDNRRVMVRLTEAGISAVERFLNLARPSP